MRSTQLLLCILGIAASAEEASCSEADHACLLQGKVDVAIDLDDDGEHDQFHLIQGNAKVSNNKAGDPNEKGSAEMYAMDVEEDIELKVGWPGLANFMKKDKLMKDFVGLEAAAASYRKMVHHHVKALDTSVKPPMTVNAIRGKTQVLLIELQKATQQLTKAVHKVTHAWVTDFGMVGPLIGAANMSDAMKSVLVDMDAQGKALVTAFYAESQALSRKVNNATLACSKTKHSLSAVFHKAAGFAKSVEALSTDSFSTELQAAKDMLPKVPKAEIDKILKKATGAADSLLRVLTPSMKDVANGVAKAFEKHCEGFPHYSAAGAGHSHASVLLLLALAMASFFM